MNTITVNQFRDNLRQYVDQAAASHEILTVSRRNGEDFVVMSQQDWQSIQETLYVLQNSSLMQQLQTSLNTHAKKGYKPTQGELDEINRI